MNHARGQLKRISNLFAVGLLQIDDIDPAHVWPAAIDPCRVADSIFDGCHRDVIAAAGKEGSALLCWFFDQFGRINVSEPVLLVIGHVEVPIV